MNDNKDGHLQPMRHSAAHVLATAVKRIWANAQLGVGPVVGEGFYYDVLLPGAQTIKEDDFGRIESEMSNIINECQDFVQSKMSIDKAIQWAKDTKQPFKEELLNDLKRSGTTVAKDLDASEMGSIVDGQSQVEEVGFYTNGGFTDLCRGPHVASTGKVGAFKLTKLAGAYWRGKQDNAQMQRVYGVAFESQIELDKYLERQQLARDRDHRKLGKELDLFTFESRVGSGLPLFTPRGTWLRELLGRYSQQIRADRGFERVNIPHIGKQDLYQASGHWDKYGDELFLVKSQETNDHFALKPMNCPHHIQIFDSQPRTYKDLPVRYMENTTIYRDEKSGEMHGLSRVRSITQDDCHAFCREDQIEGVAQDLIAATKQMYDLVGMDLIVELSFRDDSDGYYGDEKLWKMAEERIESVAKNNDLDYNIVPGEAAFYGPKIDFRAVDSLGRTWQLVTIQFDFVQPQRFKLEYANRDGGLSVPVMIHSTLLGSLERFLSVYIEHTGGDFPFWLSPEQVRIVTVNDTTDNFVDEITSILSAMYLMEPLKFNELRYSIDNSKNNIGKKIHAADKLKVPVVLIVGPRDAKEGKLTMRSGDEETLVDLSELREKLMEIAQNDR